MLVVVCILSEYFGKSKLQNKHLLIVTRVSQVLVLKHTVPVAIPSNLPTSEKPHIWGWLCDANIKMC